jgi:hypothetical protein
MSNGCSFPDVADQNLQLNAHVYPVTELLIGKVLFSENVSNETNELKTKSRCLAVVTVLLPKYSKSSLRASAA